MARKTWWSTVYGVAKSWTQVNDWHFYFIGFPSDSDSKESACNEGDSGSISESGRSMEKVTAFHSSTCAWKLPQTEEPSRLQSTVLQRVGHYWWHMHTHTHTELIYNVVLVSGVQQSDSLLHIYNTLHLLISNSQSIPSLYPSPFAITSLSCMSVSLFLFQEQVSDKSICVIFWIPHVSQVQYLPMCIYYTNFIRFIRSSVSLSVKWA